MINRPSSRSYLFYGVPQHSAAQHNHDADDVYAKHTGVVRISGYGHNGDDQLFGKQVTAQQHGRKQTQFRPVVKLHQAILEKARINLNQKYR